MLGKNKIYGHKSKSLLFKLRISLTKGSLDLVLAEETLRLIRSRRRGYLSIVLIIVNNVILRR